MPDSDLSAAEALVGMAVADVEQALILATLLQTNGNRTHAANILGISIRTIRNKLSAYARAGNYLRRFAALICLVAGEPPWRTDKDMIANSTCSSNRG